MILLALLLPALIMFATSFFYPNRWIRKLLPLTNLFLIAGIVELFLLPKPYALWESYLVADELNTFILLLSSIVSLGVTLSLETLGKRVSVTPKDYQHFYRFFALFWFGLIFSILANHMGIYWIGLELATLSTVYMIRTNHTVAARREAWNYMIVGTVAISLILFGIILIYASAKPQLGEAAMDFLQLQAHAKEIDQPFLFELGFAIAIMGMFIKMGFFPMNLWLPNIERASYYPVAALFSGILESAIMIGFFRFSEIAMQINASHLMSFVLVFVLLTLFVVAFLMFRTKDFMRLFSLSGIEHMALISLFWTMGGTFAALLHFAAHALMKPALFLSVGILESEGKYRFAGALENFHGWKGKLFWLLISAFFLGVISLPPSPMFFSELYGFSAMLHTAQASGHLLWMLAAIILILLLLAIMFYKFVEVYQEMNYAPVDETQNKTLYLSELGVFVLFGAATLALLTPPVFHTIAEIAQ
jgi:hydrogenase-4 component F